VLLSCILLLQHNHKQNFCNDLRISANYCTRPCFPQQHSPTLLSLPRSSTETSVLIPIPHVTALTLHGLTIRHNSTLGPNTYNRSFPHVSRNEHHDGTFQRDQYRLLLKCFVLTFRTYSYCGPGSVVDIATAYGLDGPGIESRWGEIFRTCPDRP